jgi:hypothetical protein
MNSKALLINSQLYGSAIQSLVRSFEDGDIPNEAHYDTCFEYLLQRGLFFQEQAKKLSCIEILSDLDARNRNTIS